MWNKAAETARRSSHRRAACVVEMRENHIDLADGEFITLARVVKTQGRRGEVAAEIHSAVQGRFAEGTRLLALSPEGESRRDLQIEELWPHKGGLVLKFAGVDSISQAEALVGCELQVPRRDRARLEAGWSYVSDLVGCAIVDQGREIGRVQDVQFGAGEAPLLVVTDASGKKSDIPFAEAYLEALDLPQKTVRMKLPEGMLEINAPVTAEEKQANRNHPRRTQKSRRK